MRRCGWVPEENDIYVRYHDKEWGVPTHDDKKLFEMLILEGAQAGLSWITVLKKRENYRKAFDDFNFEKIAEYGQDKIKELLGNPGIIRNKLKVESSVKNAKAFIKIREDFGSFDNYLWSFVDRKQIINNFNDLREIPVKTELSDRISKDLKKRGFNFVGSTIIYSFLQAVGIVNDHELGCFCRKGVQ